MLTWLALTVAFEFLFGHFVMGHSWTTLFQDCNILAGRLWVLVLVWIAAAPANFYRVNRRRSSSALWLLLETALPVSTYWIAYWMK